MATSIGPPLVWRGPDAFKKYVIKVRNAFFGLDVTIDSLSTDGNTIVVHWTATGRHEQEFIGLEPTSIIGEAGTEPGGQTVTATGTTLCLFTEGTIQQSWTTWDLAAFLNQFEDQPRVLQSGTHPQFQPDVSKSTDDVPADLRRRLEARDGHSSVITSDTQDRNREERTDD